MNVSVGTVFEPLKKVLIIGLIFFLIIYAFLIAKYASYNKNYFEVKLNNKEMSCFYKENYTKALLINASKEGTNQVEEQINRVDLEDKMILDVDEFEIYYKDGIRKQDTNDWLKEKGLDYKAVNDSKVELEIKRMNKIIYDDVYIKDISKYLKEPGRYYIHIYSTRYDGILTSIKTHISFNVIVGGGSYD